MKRNRYLILLLVLSAMAVFVPKSSVAAVSPISVAVVPPVQFPPEDFNVAGARLSLLWGKHRHVYGLDVGAVGNITNLNFVGIAVAGVFNKTDGTTTAIGLQAAGIANINTKEAHVYGVQAALGVNSNVGTSSVAGIQVAGIANLSAFTSIYGAQIGIYNSAQDVYGFQIGVVNMAKSLHGLQIGLVNFNNAGPLAVSPILNVGF